MGRGGSGWAGEAAGGPGRQRPLEAGAKEAGLERQQLGRGVVGGPERQRLGRGAAAVEEGAEEAGLKR